MIPALVAAVVLALAHIYGVRLTFSPAIPRSQWLSMAGGAAVAFVFLHILPELGHGQEAVEMSGWLAIGFVERHVYLVALVGLGTFYGLERAVKAHYPEGTDQRSVRADHIFWVHIGAFALYNAIIGYLLLHRDMSGRTELVTFTVAMLLHFMVNDHALRELHQRDYHDAGRWLLAAAILLGWAIGFVVDLSEAMIGVLFAFVAGAIILNVLKEELPREREARFWAFAVGAIGYSILMMLVE